MDRVFEEQEPVHEDGGEALTLEMKQAMIELFKRYEGMSGEQIRAERYKRFRKF